MNVAAQISLTPRSTCRCSATGPTASQSDCPQWLFPVAELAPGLCVSARISSCRTAAPRKRETDLLQPAQIFGASGRQARINLAVSQQERSYLLRFAGAASYGGLTGADQATYGFVGDVRCPDQSTRLPETGAPASPHPGDSSWYGHRHGDGNSMPVFGHIQADENFAILSHGSASWLEDRRLAQPAYPYGQCRAGHLIGRHRKGMRLTNGV